MADWHNPAFSKTKKNKLGKAIRQILLLDTIVNVACGQPDLNGRMNVDFFFGQQQTVLDAVYGETETTQSAYIIYAQRSTAQPFPSIFPDHVAKQIR